MGLLRLLAFNAHISVHPNIQSLFETRNGSCGTTSSGNLFQWSTILWLKKCFLNSSLELFLYSFKLCPLNSVVVAFWNNWSELIFSLPGRITNRIVSETEWWLKFCSNVNKAFSYWCSLSSLQANVTGAMHCLHSWTIGRDHSFLRQIFPNSAGQFAKFRGSPLQIFHTP